MSKRSRIEVFGRFLLLERIATGGSADIFLAHDATAESDLGLVVIKRLHKYRTDQREFVEALIDEAHVLERLSHHNIVRPIESGTIDGCPYLALEHVWGESLDTLLWLCNERQRPFPVAAALHIGIELAAALHHAHSLRGPDRKPSPVIHRDVTLGNVMITHRGEVRLLDFGIAMADQRLSRTQTGRVKGTLHYLAPEQVMGEQATPATDTYQLGVLLYKLLVGREPFPEGSPEQVLAAIIRGDVRDPVEVVPEFPLALAKTLKRALRIEPTQRFASAGAFAKVLYGLLGDRASTGQSLLAGTFMTLAGDRHREQRTYVRNLLHGMTVDTKVGRQFHRRSPRGEPDSVNVELARLLRKVEDLHHASLDPDEPVPQEVAEAAMQARQSQRESTKSSRARPRGSEQPQDAARAAAVREPPAPPRQRDRSAGAGGAPDAGPQVSTESDVLAARSAHYAVPPDEQTEDHPFRDLHELPTQLEHEVQRPPGRPPARLPPATPGSRSRQSADRKRPKPSKGKKRSR